MKPPARSTRNVAPTYVPKKRREELAPTPHADEPRNTRKPPRKNKLLERTPRGALAAAAAAAAAHRRGRLRTDRDAVVSDAVRREPRTPQGRAARRDALEDRPRTLIGRRVRVELNRAKRTLQTVVGRRLLVFWPSDAKFYRGRVAGYDSSNGKHHLVYDDHLGLD